MFDTFLPGGKDHAMMEPTTRLLPYFDGDFWPGEAEAQLLEIEKGASNNSVYLDPISDTMTGTFDFFG